MIETTTLAGGCFWCLEAVYQEMEGITKVTSGYMGGGSANPSYEEVCSGASGHAEVVQIEFDPEVTSFGEILDVFFAIHDPTTKDRQGNDIGSQYRSAIFYHSPEQQEQAQSAIGEMDASRAWSRPVVTEVQPASRFWPAEAYHQNYFRGHANQPYCAYVVAPKVEKFRSRFSDLRKGA